MSVYTGGPYGRLAVMLNTLSSLNIEIISDAPSRASMLTRTLYFIFGQTNHVSYGFQIQRRFYAPNLTSFPNDQ